MSIYRLCKLVLHYILAERRIGKYFSRRYFLTVLPTVSPENRNLIIKPLAPIRLSLLSVFIRYPQDDSVTYIQTV